MKLFRTILMAFAAILSVGIVSCDKENNNGNVGNNGGDNPGGGSNTTTEWVDLGLPSGLLWAKCNLGAKAPEEHGDYYAWGETQTKDVYRWNTYRYCTADLTSIYEILYTLTKYNYIDTLGATDTLTVLEAMDDAASANLGGGARTPTKEDWEELIANTTSEWTTVNGVNGRKMTASNGNSIFLPAAGSIFRTDLTGVNNFGLYWASTLGSNRPSRAWGFYFQHAIQGMDCENERSHGQSIRPVRSAQ